MEKNKTGVQRERKTSEPIYFFNKLKPSIKSIVLCSAAIFMLALLSGCIGMAADSITRSIVTGKTYSEMSTTLPPLKDGNGRLFLYRTDTSTKTSVVMNYGLMKNSTLCTVDDTAYEIIWEAFEYFDLPVGQHEITCGEDIIGERNFWSGKVTQYKKGTNRINVTITNAAETFVRVDLTEKEPFFKPVLVNKDQGQAEIVALPYQKRQGHRYSGGKISGQ